ncbi:nucleolar zinc-finger protein [Penicillium taxi]|uniref:nucleolar zinc-finger protein n=1 Tax=Penicillium taxi TaxID=168475 RepID=UPI0025459776|nr:nucleolar zinc-finger protein [Penicillium taxi]KAJ5894771.1 nucleolar zinc-finger protein [Penicillium taxi]
MSTDAETTAPESQFQNIGDIVQNDETGVMEVESLCMNCHENGVTRLLLLRVPFFRDIIVESFYCEHCNFSNNGVKTAGEIQEQGCKYTLEVENEEDLQRQVIRSDISIFKVESLGIEMPKGESQLTNIEGVIQRIHENLSSEQPLRKTQAPELYEALEPLIVKLQEIMDRKGFPFTISLEDPTGNSYIAPILHDGKKYRRAHYYRTHEQNEELGITGDPEAAQLESVAQAESGNPEDLDIVNGKVYALPAECPGCTKPCTVHVQRVDIPYFKEVYLWSNVCEHCGLKSSDVRTGGEVPEKGKRITLEVKEVVDLSRDILKSDTCAVQSDELELSVMPGTLGGKFSTVEGLLSEIKEQLHGQIFDIAGADSGDSLQTSEKDKWTRFFDKLDAAIAGDLKFTITLEDPMGNSYVQDLCAPAADPQLHIEEYTRTKEEEDDLGLTDMKTEGYEEDAAIEAAERKAANEEEEERKE